MQVRRVFLAVGLLAAGLSPATAEPVRVGVLLPYSGTFAALGEEITRGLELGFDTFGAAVGRPFVLVKEDTAATPATGLAKARKLVLADEVDLLTGVVHSGVLGALRDFVHGAHVPLVVANAGNVTITGPRCSPWIVRVSFSNDQIVREMGPWMRRRGFERVFLMALDYAAGHQMMDSFRRGFVAGGGAIVGEEYPPFGTITDFAPYFAKVQATRPDALFVFFSGGTAVQFVKDFDAFGLKDRVTLAGAGWLVSPLHLAAQGSAAAGVLGILNYVPTIDMPANRRFQDAYQARHGRIGSEFAVQGYDAARLIVEALHITGGDTDDKVALARALRGASFEGPRGLTRIDPATGNVIQNIYVFETKSTGGTVAPTVVDVIPDVQDPPNGCRL